jgi:peptidoglycan/xylan/chitin deacetylase (PgdA/CDA1 family)
LMYHSTFPKDIGQYNIYPSVFEKDLAYLKKNGYTAIDVKDLIDWKNGAFKMPGKSVMITLDDGYLTNYYYAYPLMKKYGMKGVMSVVGSLIDENYRAGSKNTAAHVNYEQIAEMHKSGFMEIQNHTYGLHKNTKDKKGLRKMRGESYKNYKERLSKDLLRLNESLESHTGIRCRAVAFPFGVYSKETVEIIDGLGFKVSFTCAAGINYIQKEGGLHLLKRINRQGGIPTEKFFKQYGME